jgi:putative endonuclease
MAPTFAKSLGERTEQLALDHLQAAGLALVARNFRCRVGEIDLVMLDGDCLVIVEVRCRQSAPPAGSRFAAARFPSAIQSIGPHKQRKLTRAALFFLGKYKSFRNHKLRFDVVAFDGLVPAQYTLQWVKDAFRPGG